MAGCAGLAFGASATPLEGLEAALAAHEAEAAGTLVGEEAEQSRVGSVGAIDDVVDQCLPDELLWQRSADIVFCAALCTSDAECADGELCRVLDAERPHDVVLVDELQEAPFAPERALAAAEGLDVPEVEDEPELAASDCTEECEVLTTDLTIRRVGPVAVCDPFANERGALLSAAEEEALASGVPIEDSELVER